MRARTSVGAGRWRGDRGELQDDGRRQGQAGGRRLARQPEGLGRQVAARRGRLQEHGPPAAPTAASASNPRPCAAAPGAQHGACRMSVRPLAVWP